MKILITGGAGYVGSKLSLFLSSIGHDVRVLDTLWFYNNKLEREFRKNKIEVIKGDFRNTALLKEKLRGIDEVIHLAAIANDPSFDKCPSFGKSVNFEAIDPFCNLIKASGVGHVVFASSSAVYGVNDISENVEETTPSPLTDYAYYKLMAENVFKKYSSPSLKTTILRPATVCGLSPRLRLDVVVNLLTSHAYYNKEMTVIGEHLFRPNIHIDDLVSAYSAVLDYRREGGGSPHEVFNVVSENLTLNEIALLIKDTLKQDCQIKTLKTEDRRSYHINGEKIKRMLGLRLSRSIRSAVEDLVLNFANEKDCFAKMESCFNVSINYGQIENEILL